MFLKQKKIATNVILLCCLMVCVFAISKFYIQLAQIVLPFNIKWYSLVDIYKHIVSLIHIIKSSYVLVGMEVYMFLIVSTVSYSILFLILPILIIKEIMKASTASSII